MATPSYKIIILIKLQRNYEFIFIQFSNHFCAPFPLEQTQTMLNVLT